MDVCEGKSEKFHIDSFLNKCEMQNDLISCMLLIYSYLSSVKMKFGKFDSVCPVQNTEV